MLVFGAITMNDRRRAREIFAEPLRRLLQDKVIASNATLSKQEWSREATGEHNLATETLVAQPPEVQIDLALGWLERLCAITSRRSMALDAAERLLHRRRRMAHAAAAPEGDRRVG